MQVVSSSVVSISRRDRASGYQSCLLINQKSRNLDFRHLALMSNTNLREESSELP